MVKIKPDETIEPEKSIKPKDLLPRHQFDDLKVLCIIIINE